MYLNFKTTDPRFRTDSIYLSLTSIVRLPSEVHLNLIADRYAPLHLHVD